VGLGLVGNPPCFLIRNASHSAFAAYCTVSPIHLSDLKSQIDRNGSSVFLDQFACLCIRGHDGRRRFSDENSVADYKGSGLESGLVCG